MKKIFLYVALFAAVSTACNKTEIEPIQKGDEPGTEVEMITETVTGRQGVATKATIANSDASFKWTAGDNIAVHVSNGDSHKYVFTSDEGASGASVAEASASFTVVYEEGYSRDAFAVFPSTIVDANATNYGQDGSTLDVTLPSGYTLAEVSGETSPGPMIATNTAGADWDFYQICCLLRLTVNNIPPTAKRLEIDFDGKQVWGDFSIASPVTPSTSVIATADDDSHDMITITKDGTDVTLNNNAWLDVLVLNIPLPAGTYTNISITAYDALTGGNVIITTGSNGNFAYTASNSRGRKLKASFPVFSVSSTEKVTFAPGNLQYLGNTNGTGTWRFAEHQYDFMGDGPTSGTNYQGNVSVDGYSKYNASADPDVARDLFGWGTSGYNSKYPYMTSTNNNSYYNGSLTGTDYDWGVYHSASGHSDEKITNGGDYSWRLFTADEWAYIISREGRVYTRTDVPTFSETKNLYASATVLGVKGIILFPDNWDGSLDRSIIYGNASNGGYTKTICDDAEKWALFETRGCVFLPAAHVRSGVTMDYWNNGHYWSGTIFTPLANNYRGGTLEFSDKGAVTTSSTNACLRKLGQSVRLIRDLE